MHPHQGRIQRSLPAPAVPHTWCICCGAAGPGWLSHMPTGQVSAECPGNPSLLEAPNFSRSTRGFCSLSQNLQCLFHGGMYQHLVAKAEPKLLRHYLWELV